MAEVFAVGFIERLLSPSLPAKPSYSIENDGLSTKGAKFIESWEGFSSTWEDVVYTNLDKQKELVLNGVHNSQAYKDYTNQ